MDFRLILILFLMKIPLLKKKEKSAPVVGVAIMTQNTEIRHFVIKILNVWKEIFHQG